MSDVQQPITQTTAADTTIAAPKVTDWAQPEITTGTTTATDVGAPPAQDDAIAPVDTVAEAAEVKKPLTDGVLGYKAPGLVKSLRFSKKYFWLGKEAVPTKDLHQYLRGEKPEHAHPNAAWSSQTGEGLLYFSKSAEQKASPAGIINLTEISDLTKDGALEFHFKLHGHKHVMQAGSAAERDEWVAALDGAAAEAKASPQNVVESAGYKEQLEKLGKPTTPVVGAGPAKVDNVASRKSTDGLRADETSSSSDEEGRKGKNDRARSASRKRGSLFGSLLGKKANDEKKVDTKDDKTEAAPPKLAEPAGDSNVHDKPTDASFDAEAVAARVVAEPVVPTSVETSAPTVTDKEPSAGEKVQVSTPVVAEPTSPAVAADTPKPNKRNSFFGLFKKETPAEEKSDKEVMRATTPKESDATAKVAATPDAHPIEIPQQTPVVGAEPSPSTPKEKSTGFFGKFLKQDKTKPTEKKVEKSDVEEAPVAQAVTAAESTPAPVPTTEPSAPVASPKDEAETPTVDATTPGASKAADPAKDKRRSSFFPSFGGKKEKKPEGVPDSENVEGEAKSKSGGASPMPKLGGLFRMPSRSAKAHLDGAKTAPESKVADSAPQVPETVPILTTATPLSAGNVTEAENSQAGTGAIADVVPEAVTVGQPDKAGVVPATA